MSGRKNLIVQVTTVHKPFDTRIFYKECRSLAASGFEVKLIAKHPENEVIDGVQIISIPDIRNKYLRLVFSGIFAFYRCLILGNDHQNIIYHFHDPELLWVGFTLKLFGHKVIYDVHEDVPRQILTKEWLPARLRRVISDFAEWMESKAGSYFDMIVAAEPVTFDRFPPGTAIMVQNFPISEEFIDLNTDDYTSRNNKLVYVGDITIPRGIQEITSVLSELPESYGTELELGGLFASAATEKMIRSREAWKQVIYNGWMSRDEVVAAFSRARIGLVVLHKIPNYVNAYPTKMLEYMAAGLPVISSDIPLWRSIVEEADCGILIDPVNTGELKDAVIQLLEDPERAKEMGERGRKLVQKKYSWETEFLKLETLYKGLML